MTLQPHCPACWTPWAEAFEPDIDTVVQCPSCDSSHLWSEWCVAPRPLEDVIVDMVKNGWNEWNETREDSDD